LDKCSWMVAACVVVYVVQREREWISWRKRKIASTGGLWKEWEKFSPKYSIPAIAQWINFIYYNVFQLLPQCKTNCLKSYNQPLQLNKLRCCLKWNSKLSLSLISKKVSFFGLLFQNLGCPPSLHKILQ